MKKLRLFFSLLALVSLACSPLYSDVVLTDEEYLVIDQTLVECETGSSEVKMQLIQVQGDLIVVSKDLNLSQSELRVQEKSYEQQLKEERKDKVRTALIVGIASFLAGAIVTTVVVVAVN